MGGGFQWIRGDSWQDSYVMEGVLENVVAGASAADAWRVVERMNNNN